MIGFSADIYELATTVTEELLARSRKLGYPAGAEYLLKELRGAMVASSSFMPNTGGLTRLLQQAEAGECELVYNGSGYPLLFVARGELLKAGLLEAAGLSEAESLVDSAQEYFLVFWDLS